MKNVVIFGGSGGLGSKVTQILKNEYNIIALSSKDVNISSFDEVRTFFHNNYFDIVINLSGFNEDVIVHKINKDHIPSINKQIDINIKGNINLISSCLPDMRKNNYGRIIIASSVLSEKPVIGTGLYSGCKGFIDSFVRSIAIENCQKNISCNSIQLGYFDGGLTHKIEQKFLNSVLDSIPIKRFGYIEELANTIKFLINTPYVNGTNIKINGGIDF